MNNYFSVIISLFSFSTLGLHAQEQDSAPSAPKSPPLTDSAKHLAKQNAEAAKSPQLRNKALTEMRKRARLVIQKNTQFVQEVKDGKAIPFASLRQRYLNEFPMHINAFKARHSEILTTKDLTPERRKFLILALQEAPPQPKAESSPKDQP